MGAAFLSGLAFSMWVEELSLSARGNRVEFSAPKLHFLTGKPLQRMHNSDQVMYAFRATLMSGSRTHVLQDTAARFAVSYDLFEDNFSVIKLEDRKTASRLTDAGVEAWCLQQMSMDVTGVGGSEPLWAKLDIRALDGKESDPLFSKANITDSGVNLTSITGKLIDWFSRPATATQLHWPLEAGPVTLDELRRVQR